MHLRERRKRTVGGALRQVAERERLGARQAGAAELLVGRLHKACGRQAEPGARKERAHAAEDRRRRLSGELLVDDRLGERAEDARRLLQLEAEGTDGVDDAGEGRVRFPYLSHGSLRIEAQRTVALDGAALRLRTLDRQQ